MNTSILLFALALLITSLIASLGRLRALQIAILKPAAYWFLTAQTLWILASLSSLPALQVSPAWQDQVWYWAAVISCCPLISVLGSKRPTSRVWTGFIILPLVAVLGWPAVTVLIRFPDLASLQTHLPVLIGFALVLVMGAGNYAGSRYGFSAFLFASAVMISLWPISSSFKGEHADETFWRGGAAILYGFALLHGLQQSRRPTADENRFDRLWFDFRDAFGIVWSIRIQDRINQTAEQEKWIVRLGTEGFMWETATPDEVQKTEVRLTHTLQWLLRRFVEPDWIDTRLTE